MCSVSEVGPDLLRRESLGGVGHKATDGSGPITGGNLESHFTMKYPNVS